MQFAQIVLPFRHSSSGNHRHVFSLSTCFLKSGDAVQFLWIHTIPSDHLSIRHCAFVFCLFSWLSFETAFNPAPFTRKQPGCCSCLFIVVPYLMHFPVKVAHLTKDAEDSLIIIAISLKRRRKLHRIFIIVFLVVLLIIISKRRPLFALCQNKLPAFQSLSHFFYLLKIWWPVHPANKQVIIIYQLYFKPGLKIYTRVRMFMKQRLPHSVRCFSTQLRQWNMFTVCRSKIKW